MFREDVLEILSAAVNGLRQAWRQLFVADLLFKLLAIVVLVPLVVGLLNVLLWVTERGTLTDIDVVLFLLTPAGAVGMFLVSAVWLGITAVEQAALLTLLVAGEDGKGSVLAATRWAFRNSASIVNLMCRLVGLVVAVSTPGFVGAGLVAWRLLGKHDINFYLTEKPPEFLFVVGVGIVLVVGLTGVLLRLFSGFFLAVPLLMFEGVSPRGALASSWKRLARRHWVVLAVLGSWIVTVLLITGVSTACLIHVAGLVVPLASHTLPGTIFAVGLTTLIWAGMNLVIQLFATVVFASLLYSTWQKYDGVVASSQKALFVCITGRQYQFQRNAWLILFAAGVCVGAAVLIGTSVATNISFDNNIDIIGHRGAGGIAPENTLAAIEKAIHAGAQWVEIDVQETIDGEVVVIHDSDLMKVAGIDLKVWEATRDQITAVDIGSSFDRQFHNARVPTLQEVLNICKGRMGIIIELKSYGHGQMLEQRVIDLVEAAGSEREVQCMSLSAEVVARLKELRPDWPAGLLLSLAVGDVKNIKADFLAVNARFATRQMVERAHDGGKLLYAWTCNDPVSVSSLVGRGVDGVITDFPGMARKVLEQRAELSLVQRLCVELAETLEVQPRIVQQ